MDPRLRGDPHTAPTHTPSPRPPRRGPASSSSRELKALRQTPRPSPSSQPLDCLPGQALRINFSQRLKAGTPVSPGGSRPTADAIDHRIDRRSAWNRPSRGLLIPMELHAQWIGARRGNEMMTRIILALALSSGLLLSACNTVHGAGKDIKSVGECADGKPGNC